QTGLLSAFKNAAAKKAAAVLVCWCIVCAAAMTALSLHGGIVCVLLGIGGFVYIKIMSRRQFGGMSGDLAGYIITLLQPVLALGFIFAEKVAALWF
ncbi:MAG: adenosylcobinamide-GDP ribazoletransferase, partial [Clostridia bacterium]|nr:adenosylcobinamide-GDP ribazoletransferase [Clostridia bacterium]